VSSMYMTRPTDQAFWCGDDTGSTFAIVQEGRQYDRSVYSHLGCNRNAMITSKTLTKPSKCNIGFTESGADVIVNGGAGRKHTTQITELVSHLELDLSARRLYLEWCNCDGMSSRTTATATAMLCVQAT